MKYWNSPDVCPWFLCNRQPLSMDKADNKIWKCICSIFWVKNIFRMFFVKGWLVTGSITLLGRCIGMYRVTLLRHTVIHSIFTFICILLSSWIHKYIILILLVGSISLRNYVNVWHICTVDLVLAIPPKKLKIRGASNQ